MSIGDPYDGICPACGFDEHCGCPADTYTMTLMRCPSCGGQWWREWGDTSSRCLHKRCRAEGLEVVLEPLYAPHGTEVPARPDNAPACARCKKNPVGKPGETRPDGQPTDRARYCDACIDRCHEATDFAHICVICASPEELAEMRRTGVYR